MFVLSLENGNDDPTRNSFGKYYMSLVEIKDFNELIAHKPFFDQQKKQNMKRMNSLLKCQEMIIIQHESY